MEGVEVLRLLGSGGFASVFLCRRKAEAELYGGRIVTFHKSRAMQLSCMPKTAALKRIPKSKLEDEKQQQMIEVEKRVLFRASVGPFLSSAIDYWEDEREACILLEYIDGRPLYQCIWGYRDTKQFPESIVRHFAAQIVLGLQELHALGCVHRDLKSGNILVDRHGRAHIIDFGLSEYINASGQSDLSNSRCGTPYILAPEVIRRQPFGFAADWWSFGVILYEMAQGRPPWEYKRLPGRSLEDYYKEIISFVPRCLQYSETGYQPICSHDLCTLIGQLLAVNPDERLGRNGATDVMHHPWFGGIDWHKLGSGTIPDLYKFDDDFEQPQSEAKGTDAELSSAESIDPEDNAKYFAGF